MTREEAIDVFEGLDELAANIELLGLQQPIRVRPGEKPGRYVVVSESDTEV